MIRPSTVSAFSRVNQQCRMNKVLSWTSLFLTCSTCTKLYILVSDRLSVQGDWFHENWIFTHFDGVFKVLATVDTYNTHSNGTLCLKDVSFCLMSGSMSDISHFLQLPQVFLGWVSQTYFQRSPAFTDSSSWRQSGRMLMNPLHRHQDIKMLLKLSYRSTRWLSAFASQSPSTIQVSFVHSLIFFQEVIISS